MERIAYTFGLMKASWSVLVKDKELLLFPLFSGIACLLILASFALPLMVALGDGNHHVNVEKMQQNPVLYYGLTFIYYFITYFVMIFFNSAVVACAIFRMRGGDPTLKTGFNASMSRLPQILGWALVSATVGLVLRIVEDRSRRAGAIIAGVLGMAWSVMTFLVVPILVVEKKGPIDAVKESVSLLKKTWGEQLVGHFGFGMVFVIFSFIGLVPLVVGMLAIGRGAMVLGIGLIAMAAIYIILLGLIQSTLQTIFQAAVYLYARDGRAPKGFPESSLGSAMGPAPAREE